MQLTTISGREASIFACLTDTMVAPEDPLPAVAATDAVEAFDTWLARSPAVNRLGLRSLLYALELAPLAFGQPQRLRRLTPSQRAAFVDALSSSPLGPVVTVMRSMGQFSYYGDDNVGRLFG